MKETLVVYFSKTGSNNYLAHKLAKDLEADIERIIPRINHFLPQLLGTISRLSLGIKSLKKNVRDYNKVILVGPIWMGRLIAPLYNFLKKYLKGIQKLYFATCCGSTDEIKDDKFGYGHVFKKIREIGGDKLIRAEAFPIVMVIPEDQKDNDDVIMKTRLSDDNFSGKIKERYDRFLSGL